MDDDLSLEMRMLNQGEEEDHLLLNLMVMIPLDTMNEWREWTIEDTEMKRMKRMEKERNHHYDWEIIEIRHGRAFDQREEHDENEELWRLILVSLPRWGGVTTGEEEGTTGGGGEKGEGLEGKGFGKHLVKHGEETKMVMGT